ncbi:cell wall-binding repeat-containing protein [Herbiconiux moechotypicola]|uniref:Cell wall-binding repeat-containing protein n=1 Tax=Herbiconiux moechotypicola TaxID=637393 RepID=A0ABN3DA40_9MICO|nr:cell wall-binding repeat-containing protein [Herbiconiux moechotypicola]MCS5729048.1 cell wall-binding repeat-containing protein [Herbiconiux moechotypicola]
MRRLLPSAATLVIALAAAALAGVPAGAAAAEESAPALSGTVTYPTAAHEGRPKVWLYAVTGETAEGDPIVSTTPTATALASTETGDYSFARVPAGSYVVKFTETSNRYFDVYWPQRYDLDDAEPIALSTASPVADVDASLSYRSVRVDRIAGADRFDTNRLVNDELWPDGPPESPTIYLANGLSFPDALSAGPAAAHAGGAVVLTDGTSLSASITQQLTDLQPGRIVVVGGEGSMSAQLFTQASALAPADATVRLGGADRFETSRLVAADAFCSPSPGPGAGCSAPEALFASGAGFADALAAGPAAAAADGPVILLPPDGVDEPTLTLLQTLGVAEATAVGGEASISAAAYGTLLAAVPDTTRIAGDGRYATSVALAAAFFGPTSHVYIASGTTFPDALGSGPLAAADEAPLFLSPVECLPDEVWREMLSLHTGYATLIGGLSSLGSPLNSLTRCAPAVTNGTGTGAAVGAEPGSELTPEVEPSPSLG